MIPRIIHHVWPGDDPFKYERWRQTWINNHPDFAFSFWTLKNIPYDLLLPSCRDILSRVEVRYIVKSDILRLEILRLYGGIYVDTDMESLKPLEEEMLDWEAFIGLEVHGWPCNALIGAVPHHPIIEQASIVAAASVLRNIVYANLNPEKTSGNVGSILQACPRKYPSSFFYPFGWWEPERAGMDFPEAYTKHHWTGARPGGWATK